VIRKEEREKKESNIRSLKASLTVEAALVMPMFLYFMIAFLYFLQIFTLQEQIQSVITKMGFNLAKMAYVYDDFAGEAETLNFGVMIFDTEFNLNLQEMASEIASGNVLKRYAGKYLNTDQINRSCIKDGFEGISFFGSNILEEEDCIDIIVRYKIKLPIKLFVLKDMPMTQRVRLRAWTGYEVSASYTMDEEEKDISVYITETGSVYHKSKTCSHIKLSVSAVTGIPSNLRNSNGAKYYPCEACCSKNMDNMATYYITSDGTRYHSIKSCSKIKRNVKEIPFSEIGSRAPCKRCGN